jgi:hypothetical protein
MAVGVNFTVTMQLAPPVPLAVRLQVVGVGTKSELFVPVTPSVMVTAAAPLLVSVVVFEALEPSVTLPKARVVGDGVTRGGAVIIRDIAAEVLVA